MRRYDALKYRIIGRIAVVILLVISTLDALTGTPPPARAMTYTVSDAVGLINAIIVANGTPAPDTITLEADIALSAAYSDSNGLPSITSAIVLLGNGHSLQRAATAPHFRFFHVAATGNLTLLDLTVSGGDPGADEQGGAVYNDGTLAVIHCAITRNTATATAAGYGWAAGGGILNGGELIVINSEISGNTASGSAMSAVGGGIANALDDTATVINSDISGNMVISDDAQASGGGIVSMGTVTVTNSIIANNTVVATADGGWAYGSGIANFSSGRLTATNITISGNTATASGNDGWAAGSGITNGGWLTATNVTVADNTAIGINGGASGGGITNVFSGTLTISNTIIANNTAAASANCDNAGTYDPTSANNLEYSTTGQCPGVTQTGDPQLSALANNGGPTQTMAIAADSAAIDNAAPAACPATDQRYYSRVNTCDIGAYEYQGAIFLNPPTLVKAFDPATIAPSGTSTLTIRVSNSNPIPLTYGHFVDHLPTDVTVVGAGATSCEAGTVSASIGDSTIVAYNLTVRARESCVVTVPVTSVVLGAHANRITQVSTTETGTTGLPSVIAALTVEVASPFPGVTGGAINAFDPAISKIGVLPPGGLGLLGETISWQITVTGGGGTGASDVVVTDSFPSELRIDGTSTSKGSSAVSGQTVTFFIGDLVPGEVVRLEVETTVVHSPSRDVFTNTATLAGGGVTRSATATIAAISALPFTGYPP